MHQTIYRSIFLFFIISIMFGCASPYPEPPLANVQDLYKEPVYAPDDTSFLVGTISPAGLGDAVRARAESVDMKWVYSRFSKPKELVVSSGRRSIVAICEHKYGTGSARASLEFEAKPNRRYILHCKPKTILWNKGTDFWVEDELNSETVVQASGWGPSSPPTGRVF
jgi:hypothetical protein